MSKRLLALVSLFATITGIADRAHAQAGDFVPGDFYLISPVVQGLSSTSGAIMRIDPATGAASMLVDLDLTLGRSQTMAYDPYRNRIVFTGGPVGAAANFATWLVDGNGSLQKLGFDGRLIHAFAPTGDGRIYYHDESDVTAWIGWIDAANQPHQLLDAAGAAPLLLNGLPWPNPNAMLYHAPTNSLVVAEFNTAQFSCTGTNTVDLSVRRIPLNPAGTQASGPVICTQVVVDPLGANAPVGLSLLPNGSILLVVDTNQNAVQPRMMSIDPVTLAATPFAQNGPYVGSAASNAGAWSTRRGEAVILDTFNDVLRGFSSGSSGTGTVITPSTTISTSGSSGETATLLEIPVDPCAGDFLAYGAGLGPTAPGKVPVLAGGGCPTPGASVSLAITSVRGGASGVFFIGLSQTSVPLAGGTFLVGSLVSATAIAVGGAAGVPNAGSLFLPGAIPANGALIGLDVCFQCAFNDPTAIRGATLTNGLKMEIR